MTDEENLDRDQVWITEIATWSGIGDEDFPPPLFKEANVSYYINKNFQLNRSYDLVDADGVVVSSHVSTNVPPPLSTGGERHPGMSMLIKQIEAMHLVCTELLAIMDGYRTQSGADAPAGLENIENMGDVWNLFKMCKKWESVLRGEGIGRPHERT